MEHQYLIRISMLGGFSMRCIIDGREYVLLEEHNTSKRMWTFMQYMAVFHHREISQEELIEVLWWNEESSNPATSLRTILHRARAALVQLGFPEEKNVLLYKRGLFKWSPDVKLELDTEEFDRLGSDRYIDDLEQSLEALKLYKGDFLPNAEGTPWVVSLRTYFHAKFIKLSHETAALLNAESRHSEAMQICKSAINIDPYDERCHMELMSAMASTGLTQRACQHYNYVVKLFMEQLGVTPSKEMAELYRQLDQSHTNMEMDLNVIRGNLIESHRNGAFYCDYNVFQEMYRVDARRSIRSGWVIQLALITVLDSNGEDLQQRRCSAAMEELKSVLQHSLRSGDIFSRYSPAQYLVLLPTASHENGIMVLKRIQSNYRQSLIGMTTSLEYSILPVLPAQENGDSLFCLA